MASERERNGPGAHTVSREDDNNLVVHIKKQLQLRREKRVLREYIRE